MPLDAGSVVHPGNWDRILRTYSHQTFSNTWLSLVSELVRREAFPAKPSRLHCLFLCTSQRGLSEFRAASGRLRDIGYEVELIDPRAQSHLGDWTLPNGTMRRKASRCRPFRAGSVGAWLHRRSIENRISGGEHSAHVIRQRQKRRTEMHDMSKIDLPGRHHLDAITSERWAASDQNRWTPQLQYAQAASSESAMKTLGSAARMAKMHTFVVTGPW